MNQAQAVNAAGTNKATVERTHRDRATWEELVAQYRSSGLSARAFGAPLGLASSTLLAWARRLGRSSSGRKDAAAKFLPVALTGAAPPGAPGGHAHRTRRWTDPVAGRGAGRARGGRPGRGGGRREGAMMLSGATRAYVCAEPIDVRKTTAFG